MSSKLLSKLLCKDNKAYSTQTWGRSTTATAKEVIWSSRAHMTISTNYQRKIAEPEISYGRALYFFFTDKKTRVGWLTQGRSG